jgi:hypothetical protein
VRGEFNDYRRVGKGEEPFAYLSKDSERRTTAGPASLARQSDEADNTLIMFISEDPARIFHRGRIVSGEGDSPH